MGNGNLAHWLDKIKQKIKKEEKKIKDEEIQPSSNNIGRFDFSNEPTGLDGTLDPRRPLAFHSSSSPTPLSRVESQTTSFRSIGYNGNEWNENQLLKFFDNVRQALEDFHEAADASIPGDTDSQRTLTFMDEDPIFSFRRAHRISRPLDSLLSELANTMEAFIRDEQSGSSFIAIDFVVRTHIDKLLEQLRSRFATCDHEKIGVLAQRAMVLEKLWIDRLGPNWSNVPFLRLKEMQSTGIRRDMPAMRWPCNWDLNDEAEWEVSNVAPGAKTEGSLGFQPGQWWLNMYCCMRDGVVGSAIEPTTEGRYGITALAMTSGKETDGYEPNSIFYTREGPRRDMTFKLLGNKPLIRVIRGSDLISKCAPSVGVRYDGLYKFDTYSHKTRDEADKDGMIRVTYTMKLGLVRVTEQASLDTVLKRPLPSEVDCFLLSRAQVNAEWQIKRAKA